MKRRHFLNAAAAATAGGVILAQRSSAEPGLGAQETPAPDPAPFGFEDVAAIAADRATRVYRQPVSELVGSFANLNYDQYRGIRFRRDHDPLSASDSADFAMDLLPPGMIFYEPVQINIVRDGQPVPLAFDASVFEFEERYFPDGPDLDTLGDMGWSGFRIRTTLNRPGVQDEFLVFQGASYFRAVARDTLYGLSARGLAIRTGSPHGEEFPLFTDFWVHQPAPGDRSIRIHAVLDSRSVAGAFEFEVHPGATTMVNTRVALFARVDLRETGLAPLTSMFWFSPASRRNVDDYRPACHDSDGLQMLTGAGQSLWRGLTAPRTLQISSFLDRSPRGFGLIQRARDFETYQDAEARYHLRPSAWIEPDGNWGDGEVRLVEIPVENEFNDNIVSFWLPKEPIRRGVRFDYRYRLGFSPLPPDDQPLARVRQVRSGRSINVETTRSYIIDFDLDRFGDELPQFQVSASSGRIVHAYLKPLPRQSTLRLAFEFDPERSTLSDLQAKLTDAEGHALSETWLTRWTA